MRLETGAAVTVVRKALEASLEGTDSREVSFKAGRDVVTTVDVSLEDLIRTELAPLMYPIIGEERGGKTPDDGSGYWLVDPIRGTRNFASGVPLYCVNLAFIEEGEIKVAAVGDPSRNEVVYAERDEGTWAIKDGRQSRLSVSDESRTVVIEEGKSDGHVREHVARLMAAVVEADRWDFRSLGSTLASPYLAAGRISGYMVAYVAAVHAAVGSLLVEEAGGFISDLDGNQWTLASESLLFAANPSLHAELVSLSKATRMDQKRNPDYPPTHH